MIKQLSVQNFTLFLKGNFSFGDKLNIIIGENGNGKTQILKLLYALSKSAYSIKTRHAESSLIIAQHLEKIFHAELDDLQRKDHKDENSASRMAFAPNLCLMAFHTDINPKAKAFACRMVYDSAKGEQSAIEFAHSEQQPFQPSDNEEPLPMSHVPVYLPARELLSIYPNFLSLSEIYDLPYDGTYQDTIKLLGLPYLNKVPTAFQEIVSLLEDKLGGEFYLDPQGGRFYMKFKDGLKTNIDMTAEGWRKLGTLMQLLRVGALEKDSILFWDEPEANLNPRLICLICDIIVTLCELGIQVFLTTHNLFLINELELCVARQKIVEGVRYFNFLPEGNVEQGDSFPALKQVVILDASMQQADHYLSAEV